MTGRFAPTPSGRMHIGNVYAMLGAWLSARSRGDRMLMRIEDVDKPRVVAGADQLMMDDLHWLGLDWDGEPMFQSQRIERYEYALECLRSQGVLYPCFCSRADIRAASAPNEGDGFMVYPGTCRRLLHDHPDEVRARLSRGDSIPSVSPCRNRQREKSNAQCLTIPLRCREPCRRNSRAMPESLMVSHALTTVSIVHSTTIWPAR